MNCVDVARLREIHAKGGNIMAAVRETTGSATNSAEAVKISYDLQSGSYSQAWSDPVYREMHDIYCAEMAEIISSFGPESVLEAGVGEATTLCSVVGKLHKRPSLVAGFDLSWSRIHFARRHATDRGCEGFFFCTGQLEKIPFPENSFDVVYTAHAVEPNYGRETVILRELLRVARHKLILFEPSYELGGAETRARIKEHGYCRDLPTAAVAAGGRVVLHKLLRNPMRATNQTAALVIEKPHPSDGCGLGGFACPRCGSPLDALRGNQYCRRCATVFPVIAEIPCLLPENAILATSYAPEN